MMMFNFNDDAGEEEDNGGGGGYYHDEGDYDVKMNLLRIKGSPVL